MSLPRKPAKEVSSCTAAGRLDTTRVDKRKSGNMEREEQNQERERGNSCSVKEEEGEVTTTIRGEDGEYLQMVRREGTILR